jgi:hypothetical protein
MAGQDGMDRQPQLIDQPVLQQRLGQTSMAVDGQFLAVLLLAYARCGPARDGKGIDYFPAAEESS